MSRPRDCDHGESEDGVGGGIATCQRLDKWMWFARVTKTRTLAADLIAGGKVRVNGVRVEKAAAQVKLGDTVALVTRERMRIVVVRGFAERRGGAAVAAALFEDKTPVRERPAEGAAGPASDGAREAGSGRPTKRDRRAIERFKRHAG